MEKPQQLEFDFEPKKPKPKPDYRIGYKYLLHHIEELEERLDQKDNLVDIVIEDFIDFRIDIGEDETTATREVYKTIYYDKWKNHIPGRYLTEKEHKQWFNDNHDDWFCSGPYDMSYLQMAEWETGIHDEYINGAIVKAYNHKQLKYRRRKCQ